jgi:regulatory protein
MSESLRQGALRLLARREHTRAELERKLAALGSREEIAAVLDQLEADHLLSDARFVESYIAARRSRFGSFKLRQDLRAKGVAESLIDEVLVGSGDDELKRAAAIWRRKFGARPGDAGEYARQARFLQSRGFAPDTLTKLLRQSEE